MRATNCTRYASDFGALHGTQVTPLIFRARLIIASTTLALTLAGSAVALAAGPSKGKTYEGSAPAIGVSSEGHHKIKLHAGGRITLRVSNDGRSVTVHFTSVHPLLYCNTPKTLKLQSSKSGRISASGSFKATIDERFEINPGPPSIVQVITGHFSGKTVSGKIQTNAGDCGGASSFSARVK
jgi:hypothetical protein